MRSQSTRLLFAILAIGFFAAPVALRAVGVTAEAFENRNFAEAPKLSQGWDAFQQTGRFLTDRLPLRAQAVRANTRIWTDVFGATPRYGDRDTLAQDAALPFGGTVEQDGPPADPDAAPTAEEIARQNAAQVLQGRDGWLYLQGEQDRSCAPAMPIDAALERWAGLVAMTRASGKRVVAIVPPDKASVYPEHLPAEIPLGDCARDGKQAFWGLLERSAGRTGVFPLRAELLREKRRQADLVYLRKDSHWNSLGSLTLVREALARLEVGIGVEPGEIVDPGDGPYTGDLTAYLGAPESDTQPQRQIVRAPGARRVPGRTLLVKDSYGEIPTAQLAAYFEDLRTALWASTPPGQIAREIAAADTVIFETVEREFAYRAGPDGVVGPVAAALRARLGRPRSR